MDISRDDIVRYVNTLEISPWLRGRFVSAFLGGFPTVYQFLKSSEPELKRIPSYGKAMAELITKVKDEFYRREKEAKDRILYDERVQQHINRLDDEYEKMRRSLNPVFTLKELQGVVSMMQLMALDEIDLKTLRQFLDSVTVKRGEEESNGGK